MIWYRTDGGSIDVSYAVEELDELSELVERGPDWNTIERIEIVLARVTDPMLTIETSRSK